MEIMKRIICSMVIILQSIFIIIGVQATQKDFFAEEIDIPIFIDNHSIKYNNPIVSINGVTYVPIRETLENLEDEVNWSNTGIYVYTSNEYEEGVSPSNRKYHYYKNKINFNEEKLKNSYGYKYINEYDNRISNNISDVNILLRELEAFSEKEEIGGASLTELLKNQWYDIYEDEENRLWIINIQAKDGMIIDCEVFYTVNKETGVIKKYTSIGSLYNFNHYLDEIE